MSRRRITDKLQNQHFWAFDATTEQSVPVFTPLFGFSAISSPEISVETETFKDGTFQYPRTVVKGGLVSPVSFERAASMFDSDFYSWVIYAIHGNKDFESGGTLAKLAASFFNSSANMTFRRNILVIHFARIDVVKTISKDVGNLIGNPLEAAAFAAGAAFLAGGLATAAGKGIAGLAIGAGAAVLGMGGMGPFEMATRMPARGWMLHNCIPIRYKAGSDFDANDSEISIQELELQPEYIEEFSLGIKP